MQHEDVSLREITPANFGAICDLSVEPDQHVASNVFSLAEAYVEPHAWPRGVYVGDVPVGFVMLAEDTDHGRYFLWRLMIDAQHQGKGYGRRALDLVVEHVRHLPGATELRSSYPPGDKSPAAFYRRYGFVETGERVEGEIVIVLPLPADR